MEGAAGLAGAAEELLLVGLANTLQPGEVCWKGTECVWKGRSRLFSCQPCRQQY
jgi:hypothetical protein